MRIRSLVLRIVREFIRDKRSLALIIVAPIMILTLMSFILTGEEYQPKLNVIGLSPSLTKKLESSGAKLYKKTTVQADRALKNREIDAILTANMQTINIKLEGSDPAKNKFVLRFVQTSLQSKMPSEIRIILSVTYLHGSKDMSSFDADGPILIGFFSFFFVFIISGVSFLRERTSGTLERLLATPLRRWELVIGYVFGFGIFMTIQACLITWYSTQVLDMMMVGSFSYLLLVTLLLAISALTLGTLLSSFANNELQMVQFIPLVIVPQVIFSGLFPLDGMNPGIRYLSLFMPLRYGADALTDIMIRGKGWSDISTDVFALITFALIFILLNILVLRKYRKI
ncbi:ABC transporter permease [Shimazuella kribbensis]|uniref:ABC transporter permease n=1 Tax=Shimazuella kribbensis TaxID=139808 RepID=UPI000423BCC1|nr:ABC transporter permease [Shimazuella kribbensis]